jgi:hypothetical protein
MKDTDRLQIATDRPPGQHCTINYTQAGPRVVNAAVYTPTHVNPTPLTAPSSTVSATFADGAVPKLKMLLVLPVSAEFRIDGDDDETFCTPRLVVPVAVAVTLFIDGDDDETFCTPTLKVPPVAVAVTLVIVGDDESLYTPLLLVPPLVVAVTLLIDGDDEPLNTP